MFSGIQRRRLRDFDPIFQQMGLHTVQGTGGVLTHGSKPVAGWEHSLNPGDSVATVLVDGDMGISAFGTVTYNDGKRVLAFGHPLFNLGPVDMPLAKSEVVLTLASQFQPSKMANATGVVGALRQDRHSGIMGELGATSPMIPVTLKVRSLDAKDAVLSEKDFHFNVFVHQKWTPTLMMLTLYNSISQPERFRRRDHLPAERQSGDERAAAASASPPCRPPATCRCPRPWRWPYGWATSSTACT